MVRPRYVQAALLVCLLAMAIVMGCDRDPEPQPAATAADLRTRFDALVPELLARSLVPGVQIAVIDQGAVAWHGSYGFADLEGSQPVTDHTLFNIGSISKTVAAWSVLALVDRRADLDLDSPVERYLTRWHIPESDFDASGVTLRRLLSHTSGLSVLPASESFTYPPSLEGILSKSYGSFGRLQQVRQPGAEFAYNNGNYVLLELLIEELTHLEFATHTQRTVLDPLGMDASTYAPARDRLATPHDEHQRSLSHDHAAVGFASGGLYSTATDLAKFVAATMRRPDGAESGRGILSPETVTRMLAPSEEAGGRYGLGYKMLPVSETLTLVGHDGSNPGWIATFMAAPERGVGIVVLTNSSAGGSIVADLVCTWADWEADIELTGLCRGTTPISGR
jgi:CubicO group peptidase (beta-lactamase class C family)